jgi:hypothetical protein
MPLEVRPLNQLAQKLVALEVRSVICAATPTAFGGFTYYSS